MFALNYKIDDAIDIGGEIYEVDMSFDNVLLFLDMLNDKGIIELEKIFQGINILLGVSFLYGFEIQRKIFNALLNKVVAVEEIETSTDREGNPMPVPEQKKTYDLKHDAEYIYASFMQAYGIDLFESQGELHWLKFKALLSGLPEDTKFRQVISIRTRSYPKGKHSAEERKQLRELKELYALPGQAVDEFDDEDEEAGEA